MKKVPSGESGSEPGRKGSPSEVPKEAAYNSEQLELNPRRELCGPRGYPICGVILIDAYKAFRQGMNAGPGRGCKSGEETWKEGQRDRCSHQ